MKPLRIAVLGGGHLGRIHTRLLKANPEFEVVGVVDPVAAARESIAAEFSVPTFADYSELLNGLDAAVVATPTPLHHQVTLDLLHHGIHAFVEKPITVSVAEADELIEAAEKSHLVLQVGHVERFNPAFVAVRDLIAAPRYIEAVRASGYTFRSTDVGVVLDLMIHDLDLILSLVNSPVVDVEAIGTTVIGPHEDMAHVRLKFANGCIANLNASRTSFQPQRTMQIFSATNFAAIDFATGSAKLIRPDARLLENNFDIAKLTAAEKIYWQAHLFDELLCLENVAVEKRNAIQDEQADFLRAIQTGACPQVTGTDGRQALAIAQQILQQIDHYQTAERSSTVPFSAPVITRPPFDQRKAG